MECPLEVFPQNVSETFLKVSVAAKNWETEKIFVITPRPQVQVTSHVPRSRMERKLLTISFLLYNVLLLCIGVMIYTFFSNFLFTIYLRSVNAIKLCNFSFKWFPAENFWFFFSNSHISVIKYKIVKVETNRKCVNLVLIIGLDTKRSLTTSNQIPTHIVFRIISR